MDHCRVSFPVVMLALVAALTGAPTCLEGQSRGVLQATVRVVDYRPSLTPLEAARTALWSGSQRSMHTVIASPAVHVVTQPNAGTLSSPYREHTTIVITYLH
jgi:hypothetical protein